MNSFLNIHVRILANQAQKQLAMLGASAGAVGTGMARSAGPTGFFGRTINGMRLDRFGSQLQWVGRQLQYNFTIPIVAAGVAATHWAFQNQQAMTRVTKVYGDATHGASQYGAEIKSLEKAFEALSNRFGVHQSEVIGIAASWAAAGASGLALAKSVQLTLMTMVLGEVDAAKATEALIAIQAQYGQDTQELTRTLAILNMIENQTGISLGGLIDGFSRAAGVARSAGVDVRHLGAMLAALVPASGSAANAGNALKTIFSRLLSPTKEAREVLGLMNINVDALSWKSANAEDRLVTLAKTFQKLDKAQQAVVSSVLASRYQINRFDVLMRDLLNPMGYYQRALEATNSDQKVFNQMQRELSAVLESNPRRLQILWTMLQNGAADIITPLIPLILYVVEAIKNLVTAFSNLDPSIQKIFLAFLLLIAVVGPLVRYIGSTITLIAELSIGFQVLLKPLGAAVLWLGRLMTINLAGWFVAGIAGIMTFGKWILIAVGFINKGLVSALINVVPMIFLMMGRATVALRIFAVAIPVIFAEMWTAILGATRIFATAFQALLLASAYAAGVIWRGGLFFIQTLSTTGMFILQRIWVLGLAGIQGILIAFATFAGGIWRAMLVAIQTMTVLFGLNLRKIFTQLIVMIRGAALAVGAALTGPVGIAIAVVVGLLVLFWDQIVQVFRNVVAWFRSNAGAFADAMSPFAKILNGIKRAILAAFNSLPAGIQNALMAVIRTIAAAIRRIGELLSYLNPFARHSPSLVDNVKAGMKVIADEYGSIANVAAPFKSVAADIDDFARAIAKLQAIADARKFAELRKELVKLGFDGVAEFDKLLRILPGLKRELDALERAMNRQQAVVDAWKVKLDAANAALDVQQRILDQLEKNADALRDQLSAAQQELDKYAHAPIEGMREMDDLIFQNQMDQKRLRLEMMKMEDAVGPFDQLKDRLDKINGQIELLGGEQANLRNAGAGGEILQFYDDQIDLLEQQKKQIDDQIKPLQDMQDAIQQLGREAEELDLEKSLKFDPLTRQIEQMTSAMEELPFDEIIAGITKSQAEVDRLTEAYNQAQAAVDAQQAVVDQLTAARDALQATYDAENAKLDKIKDQYQQLEDQIRKIESALNDVGAAARDVADAMKKGGGSMSPGAENFLGAAGGNFPDPGGFDQIGREGGWGDQSKLIDDFTKQLSEETANMFGKFDIFGPFKKMFGKFTGLFDGAFSGFSGSFNDLFRGIKMPDWLLRLWDLLGPPLKQIASVLKDHLLKAWRDLAPELAKFKDLAAPLAELWGTRIYPVLKLVAQILGGALLLAINIIATVLANVLGPAIDLVVAVLKGIIEILRGVIEFIVGVFTGNWSLAWQGIKDIFMGVWDAIWGIIKNAALLIYGVVKGIVEGIVNFFKWLYNVLVGHSIIPDLVNGIIGWFKTLADFAKAIWNAIVQGIKTAWDWAWNQVKTKIDWAKSVISVAISAIKSTTLSIWNSIRDALKAAWDWAWNQVKSKIDWARGQISGIISGIKTILGGLSTYWSGTVNTIKTWVDKVVGYFTGIKKRISGAFSGMFDGIKSALRSAINWAIEKWNNFSIPGINTHIPGVGTVGGFETPNLRYLAKGGMLAKQATAIVGEGRNGYPEFVIPTDPMYRNRALKLFSGLSTALGVRVRRFGGDGAMMYMQHIEHKEVHFHGDLSFPNVKDGNDAEEFLRNLEALISED